MAVGNTGTRIVGSTEFYGGLSTDAKIGIENSYADAECLDVRKSPGQMSVLPMSRKLPSSSTVTGLMVAMTQTKDGNIWGIDEGGKLYKIDDENDITVVSDEASSSGFSLESYEIDDGIWFADGGHKLYSYGRILNPVGESRGTTEFETLADTSEYVVNSITIQSRNSAVYYQSNASKPRASAPNSRTIGTSINENQSDKVLFLPGITPLAQVGIGFKNKPSSGTVYVIMHDENNNTIASSVQKQASDCVTDGFTYFDMRPNPNVDLSAANQTTIQPWAGETLESGTEYHLHIVVSNSGWTMGTWDGNSVWTTGMIDAKGYVLAETFNKKHPMAAFDKLYIGNGRYVAALGNAPLTYIDDTLYTPHMLRLDDGYEVCSLATSDEYLMIGAEKFSQNSSRGFQAGRIYFWDMESEGPNFYIDCTMGSPQAIFNFGNIVYIIIAGALYAYTGGKELVKARTLKGTDTEFSGASSITEVYPNMMTVRREIMLVGFPSTTTAYGIRYGIHGWGSIDKNYPNSFTYNYRIPVTDSSGYTVPQFNSDEQHLRIGCVYNFGDTLFYSYEVTTIDPDTGESETEVALAVVDNESGASTSFFWKSLQYDAGSPALQKMALRVGVYMNPLPNGSTITPIYRIDDGEWQTGPATAVAGKRYVTCEVNERIHEFQYGFIGTTANTTDTPVIKQVSAEVRILDEERKL